MSATEKTEYYRIQNSFEGYYGLKCDGMLLATRGDKEWLLSCSYSQIDEYGEDCYRQFVDGRQMNWPVEAIDKSINKVNVLERIFDDPEYPAALMLHSMNAKEIREFLKV